MSIGIRIKFWLFENYWWLLSAVLIIAVVTLVFLKEPLPTIATVVGVILSLAYFLQKQKLEETRLFREIFKECNARYDAMNEELDAISKLGEVELSDEQRMKVVDYLNLCGEEYLYFKRGYIDPTVWKAWSNGMELMMSVPAVRKVWLVEKKTASYYGLPL